MGERGGRRLRTWVAATAAAVLATGPVVPAHAADEPPLQQLQVVNALPPGNSGHITPANQARGMASGNPDDYGQHIDDQREMFWDGKYKAGRFHAQGTPETPRDGVRIYRDDFGVPAIYGDSDETVWWGAGWAAGQDRLFLADAVRRTGRGSLAELTGTGSVPADTQTRVLTYSQSEYDAMFAALPASSQRVIRAYAEGLNAWITKVRSDPTLLPAEYVLLQTLPEPWSITDTLAAGVAITRTVASAGGDEWNNIETLRSLEAALGKAAGRGAFNDLTWMQDTEAPTTVPESAGRFPNTTTPAAARDRVFQAAADYALSLPPELASGPGTGGAPEPQVPGGPAQVPAAVQQSLKTAADSVNAWSQSLHGGSYQLAVSGKRSANGKPLLLSAPQLGYTYPTLLWELEVHGGGYDARGTSVPGLPTVGIGYGTRIAWAVTTGYSKTIDSFIETTRTSDGKLQYLHNGTWKDATCHTETVRYRASAEGVPTGPPVFSTEVPVCRTVHGPIVAVSNDGTKARTQQLAMFRRELETVNGILAWNRAKTLEEFRAGVAQVTWNENVMYADADGHIAYWHPGLFPRRHPETDPRFPTPGDGSRDWNGTLTFDEMPHVVDPAQGYLANWNNKPAEGWTDTLTDPYSGRPSGKVARVQNLLRLLAADSSVTFADLQKIDYDNGVLDTRAFYFLPLLRDLQGTTDVQRRALALLRGWNARTYGPGADVSAGEYTDESVTDGPATTLFAAFMNALVAEVGRGLPPEVVKRYDAIPGDIPAERTSHIYDGTPLDNLALRELDPDASSLTPSRDYLAGRSGDAVLLAALDAAIAGLTQQYGADPASWRQQHPRRPVDSLTGVIGPSLTMPFLDRGSWTHLVSFNAAPIPTPGLSGGPRPDAQPTARPRGVLPATGSALPAVATALVVAAAAGLLLRRRRRG